MIRNRMSAQTSRDRKKNHVQNLENDAKEAQIENFELKK